MFSFDTMLMLVSRYSGLFLEGVVITLKLALVAVLLGTVLGTILALLKTCSFKPAAWIVTAYIEVFRGTPLLLQLYLFYFLVPQIVPWEPSKFACVATALVLNTGAYISEIIRAGIQAVDYGQTEAARSLGLNGVQTMWKVVLPQALKNILPALGNEFVTDIKETSLASTFFVGDLMSSYRTINGALYLTLEPLIIVGIIYFILTFTLSKLVAMLERRLRHDN
jgi:His/Glu/Gln/Arg/opine family amino acid ABC transporter permease subunit